jgi:uncharacterized protein (UPF0548 family)
MGAGLLAAAVASLLWYVRRRLLVRMQITELNVAAAEAMPHPIPLAALQGAPVQLLTHGAGPLFVRSYQVDIAHPEFDRETLMARIIADIDDYSPGELAQFEKTRGEASRMAVGDEYFVHIVGPWDGPVRVIDVTPTSFSFVTLRGHLEAGEISFSLLEHPEDNDAIRFRIQSWARSSNRITDLFYRTLGVSRFAQTTMWSTFCQRVVEASGGEQMGDIQVMSHKVSAAQLLQQQPEWQRYATQFERWSHTDLNYDINETEQFTERNGWKIDDYGIGLPGEDPGTPVPGGSFEAAKFVMQNYQFPDPNLITGIFVPDGPLEGRIMILRARFLFFTFYFGVRVADVIDEVRPGEKGGDASVWGYSYRTLEGHFEMGQITFEVWKMHQTGEVRFRVHSYSKPARIRNPLYRLGFALFGRSLQQRFARTSTRRMQQLVVERLAPAPSRAEPIEVPEVDPIDAHPETQEKHDEAVRENPPPQAPASAGTETPGSGTPATGHQA